LVAGAPQADAFSSTAGSGQTVLCGRGKSRSTSIETLRLEGGRVAYLKFHVPSSWLGHDVLPSFDPSGAEPLPLAHTSTTHPPRHQQVEDEDDV